MKRFFTYFLFILCVYSSIFIVQNKLVSQREVLWQKERLSYLPKSESVKPFMLGYSSTYGNYLWIRTMLYFGTHYKSDQVYTWLITMVDIVTKLNPYFYPAYEFAGTILPTFTDNPDAARIILHRGITHLGNTKYSIPFYLGWLYFDYYHDYKSAAYFLHYASMNKTAPPFITKLAADLYKRENQEKIALDLLYSAYHSTENPVVKNALEKKIIAIQKKPPAME